MRYLVVLLALGLTVYALIDCVRTDGAQVKAMPKALWIAVIVIVTVIGPIAWLLAGRDRGNSAKARPAPTGPVAPDDDPAFLRELDLQRRRRAERERLEAEQQDTTQPGDDEGTADVR